MGFPPLVFVLCLTFCLGNGAPPKEVGTSSKVRTRHKFSNQEDKFIIEELLRLPGDSVQIFSKGLWDHMEEKHREKWQQNTSGFSCERTGERLRERLTKTLVHNYPHVTVKVPETLFLRFPLLKKNKPKQVTVTRHLYTPEETEFILEELMKPSCDLLQASSTWKAMKEKHDAKRKERCQGFENERTRASLRSHLEVMKNGDLLPNEVLEKLRTKMKAGSSSMSSPPKETNETQETDEHHGYDDAWFDALMQNPIDIEPLDFS